MAQPVTTAVRRFGMRRMGEVRARCGGATTTSPRAGPSGPSSATFGSATPCASYTRFTACTTGWARQGGAGLAQVLQDLLRLPECVAEQDRRRAVRERLVDEAPDGEEDLLLLGEDVAGDAKGGLQHEHVALDHLGRLGGEGGLEAEVGRVAEGDPVAGDAELRRAEDVSGREELQGEVAEPEGLPVT